MTYNGQKPGPQSLPISAARARLDWWLTYSETALLLRLSEHTISGLASRYHLRRELKHARTQHRGRRIRYVLLAPSAILALYRITRNHVRIPRDLIAAVQNELPPDHPMTQPLDPPPPPPRRQ